MRHRASLLASSLFLGALSAPALAQQGPPPPSYPAAPPSGYPAPAPGYPATYPAVGVIPRPPGYETHDGFYLNLQLGPGYTSMSASADGLDVTISGGGAAFSLGIGGAVAPNFILFGHLLGHSSIDPKVEIKNVGSGTADGSATVSGFGVGAAYYVMPVNLFIGGSALATQLSADDNDPSTTDENTSEIGFGVSVMAGKEWWVSDNWGLGAALQFLAATMKDKATANTGSKPSWTTVSLGLTLSATFN